MTNLTDSMDLEHTLEELERAAPAKVAGVADLDSLDELEAELTGKRSPIAEARRGIGKADPEQRKVIGVRIKETADRVQSLVDGRRVELEQAAEAQMLVDDHVDMTLERHRLPSGSQHVLTTTMQEVSDIFLGLGYRIADGPEIETTWYNFDALNTPPEHPSRSESDTFYIDWAEGPNDVLLRAHTSPMQVRYMETHQPPVYVVVPGRVFRSDTFDATHSPVFHQIEGLAVDTDISFTDLKGTLAHFAREFFGPGREVRLLPHFFPFTEPSAEMFVSCFACDGSGCRVCSSTGWIELMGCGMVDPNVLTAVGYDTDAVSGFAFGMGVERLAQVRHGVTDVRDLYENDVRTLRQFR